MSTVENNVLVVEAPGAEAEHNHHDPNLAHHFDTPDQQFQTGKLGMWVFLGTEILMFGGLFCAYSVYRHNHPEVFDYAHQFLNKWWGGLNTVILITSSLTMAWGVRAAQMGNRRLLMAMLALTWIGAGGFMLIKTVEYTTKWNEKIFIGSGNLFYKDAADVQNRQQVQKLEEEVFGVTEQKKAQEQTTRVTPEPPDPNFGTGDQAKIVPPNVTPAGLAPAEASKGRELPVYDDLDSMQRHRVYTFFAIYFFMTGLHGIHVLVGMGLIFWILYRASSPAERDWVLPSGVIGFGALIAGIALIAHIVSLLIFASLVIAAGVGWTVQRRRTPVAVMGNGEFGPTYFTPVDLVGLYWHLVDLIWIFLFPLLYLIH